MQRRIGRCAGNKQNFSVGLQSGLRTRACTPSGDKYAGINSSITNVEATVMSISQFLLCHSEFSGSRNPRTSSHSQAKRIASNLKLPHALLIPTLATLPATNFPPTTYETNICTKPLDNHSDLILYSYAHTVAPVIVPHTTGMRTRCFRI